MVNIFSDNYRLSIPADIATIVWANSLMTTVHAIRQSAAIVKMYWSHKIMSLFTILKYCTVINLRILQKFRNNNIRSKLKLYCRHTKFIHNFRFFSKGKETSKAMQVKFGG
jgi:hypothetical protein